MRLFDPYAGEQLIIDVLKRRHLDHVAALERDYALSARTIEPLATIDHLSGPGVILSRHTTPVVLVGLTSTNTAERGMTRTTAGDKVPVLDLTWDLNLQLVVTGMNPRDTIKRRGWYAMTLIECLMQRLPRDQDVFDTLTFGGQDFTDGESVRSNAKVVGEARIAFTVVTRAAVQMRDLPPDDTDLTPGEAGGAPSAPYEPPVPWPEADPVTADIDQTH